MALTQVSSRAEQMSSWGEVMFLLLRHEAVPRPSKA